MEVHRDERDLGDQWWVYRIEIRFLDSLVFFFRILDLFIFFKIHQNSSKLNSLLTHQCLVITSNSTSLTTEYHLNTFYYPYLTPIIWDFSKLVCFIFPNFLHSPPHAFVLHYINPFQNIYIPNHYFTMSERKLMSKYVPKDFDPSELPKLGYVRSKLSNKGEKSRIMLPFSLQCLGCGELLNVGKKIQRNKRNDEEKIFNNIHFSFLFSLYMWSTNNISYRSCIEGLYGWIWGSAVKW